METSVLGTRWTRSFICVQSRYEKRRLSAHPWPRAPADAPRGGSVCVTRLMPTVWERGRLAHPVRGKKATPRLHFKLCRDSGVLGQEARVYVTAAGLWWKAWLSRGMFHVRITMLFFIERIITMPSIEQRVTEAAPTRISTRGWS